MIEITNWGIIYMNLFLKPVKLLYQYIQLNLGRLYL